MDWMRSHMLDAKIRVRGARTSGASAARWRSMLVLALSGAAVIGVGVHLFGRERRSSIADFGDLELGAEVFSGRLVDARGAAVPQATIAVGGIGVRPRVAISGSDGAFYLDRLPKRSLPVVITADGYCKSFDWIDLPSRPVVMKLDRPCVVRGIVIGPDGVGLAGVRVDGGRRCAPTAAGSVLTGPDGQFTLLGLRVGEHDLSAALEDGRGGRFRAEVQISLGDGETLQGLRLRIPDR